MRGAYSAPLFRRVTLPTVGLGYSVYGGEGGLLCRPISWACSAYWGAGGDPTLSTGSRGAYSAPLFRGYSAYWGAGGGGGGRHSVYGGEGGLLCPPISGE